MRDEHSPPELRRGIVFQIRTMKPRVVRESRGWKWGVKHHLKPPGEVFISGVHQIGFHQIKIVLIKGVFHWNMLAFFFFF